MKIYYKEDDALYELFCNLMNCEGEQPTESDPTGCTGCNAQEEWADKYYSEHMIDESQHNEFISKEELFEWIDNELNYEPLQKAKFAEGYFHALKKIKSSIIMPELNLNSGKTEKTRNGND